MKPATFDLEVHFQQMLQDYPDLLSGELINPEVPRKWLLVAAELEVANGEDPSAYWWIDHLFLDQDGIPTIVEVKCQSDSRLRREVVAQMLDYAANGLIRWSANSLRTRFEAECAKRNEEPSLLLANTLKLDDYEKFWMSVKGNLDGKRVRMLLVADVIPREVKVVIEFLNAQMNPAEILALELRQFVGENGLRTVVPALFGQTEMARGLKATVESKAWDFPSVLERMKTNCSEIEVSVCKKLVEWMKSRVQIKYGRGKEDGSISAVLFAGDDRVNPLTIYTNGKMSLNAGYSMAGTFALPQKRLEWLEKMNQIEGIQVPLKSDKFPALKLSLLSNDSTFAQFIAVMDWFVDEFNAAGS